MVGLILLGLLSGPAWAAAPSGPRAGEASSAARCQQELSTVLRRLETLPDDEELLMRQGSALFCLGRRKEALAVFQRVLSLNPRMPSAHNNVAVILAGEGKDDEARAALDRALRSSEATATAYDNLSRLYAYQASQAYRKAFKAEGEPRAGRPTLALSMAPGPDERASERGQARSDPPATSVPSPLAGVAMPPPRPREPATVDTPASAASVSTPASAPSVAAGRPSSASPSPASKTPERASEAASSPAREEVLAALETWARAWSRQDMEAYEAAYVPGFKGSMDSHAEWRKERAARITARKQIKVAVSEVTVSIAADQAQVRFLQNYESDGRRIRARKSIEMRRLQGKWLIHEESGR